MITTGALLHGKQLHLLEYSHEEHALAAQLGGNDPNELAQCTRLVAEQQYDEVNLNVGCPSDRVQKGTFGACLMAQPKRVATCIAAMKDACDIPVSVKCRLGIDSANSEGFLDDFIGALVSVGCTRIYLHARIAVLGGLSAAQNRSIPPLMPQRARRVKQDFPQLEIIMNGGITSVDTALEHLAWADGVMIGRAAYHQPDLLADLEHALSVRPAPLDKLELLCAYKQYIETQLSKGQRLHSTTRHLLSSCNGLKGARRFRQLLSDHHRLKANDITLVDEALAQVFERAA